MPYGILCKENYPKRQYENPYYGSPKNFPF